MLEVVFSSGRTSGCTCPPADVVRKVWEMHTTFSSVVSYNTPSRPDEIFRLDLTGADLIILGALLDVLYQLLLLVFQLDPLSV